MKILHNALLFLIDSREPVLVSFSCDDFKELKKQLQKYLFHSLELYLQTLKLLNESKSKDIILKTMNSFCNRNVTDLQIYKNEVVNVVDILRKNLMIVEGSREEMFGNVQEDSIIFSCVRAYLEKIDLPINEMVQQHYQTTILGPAIIFKYNFTESKIIDSEENDLLDIAIFFNNQSLIEDYNNETESDSEEEKPPKKIPKLIVDKNITPMKKKGRPIGSKNKVKKTESKKKEKPKKGKRGRPRKQPL